MTIELFRDNQSKKGQHGVFELGGKIWHSLEPPWLDNAPFKSCIPPGDYVLIPHLSKKWGSCYIMVNPENHVWQFEDSKGRADDGRYACLFTHRGNEVENFVGCIGASHTFDVAADRLLSSTTESCKEVNRLVVDEGSFRLKIHGPNGGGGW